MSIRRFFFIRILLFQCSSFALRTLLLATQVRASASRQIKTNLIIAKQLWCMQLLIPERKTNTCESCICVIRARALCVFDHWPILQSKRLRFGSVLLSTEKAYEQLAKKDHFIRSAYYLVFIAGLQFDSSPVPCRLFLVPLTFLPLCVYPFGVDCPTLVHEQDISVVPLNETQRYIEFEQTYPYGKLYC